MREYELKDIMNEVADKIYESAYANMKLANEFWRDSIKAEGETNREAGMMAAREFYSRAVEDLSLISELTGQDWEAIYEKAPFPLTSDVEITRWWE